MFRDYTTSDVLDQVWRLQRKEDYDNSLFGFIHNWATEEQRQPVQLPDDASLWDQAKEAGLRVANMPMDMVAGGAKTMAHWLGSAAYPEMIETADMLAPLGIGAMAGLARAVPRGAVGSAGGKLASEALDMSHEARMARAKEMGFDTDTPLFHGTAAERLDAFDVGKAGSVQYSDWGPGVYFTPSEWTADSYRTDAIKKVNKEYNAAYQRYEDLTRNVAVKNGVPQYSAEAGDALKEFQRIGREMNSAKGGQVVEAYASLKNPYILPYQSMPDHGLARRAMDRGHDGIKVLNGDGSLNEVVVFNPKDIRSVNAAFDPAKADSANLLAADQSRASMPGLLAGAADEPTHDDELMRLLKLYGMTP